MKNISEEIIHTFIEYIALGIYSANDKLPSVRELSTKYHVNPNTIAKVYTALEEMGYIYAVAAKGYYVAEVNAALIETVKEEMKSHIQELLLLSKIIHMDKEELKQLIDKEGVK